MQNLLISIVLWGWIVAATLAAGALCLRPLYGKWSNSVQHFVFSGALGLGMWLLLLFWSGWLIAYTRWVGSALTAVFSVPLFLEIRSYGRQNAAERMLWLPRGFLGRVMLILCAVVVLLGFAGSFAPVADMADALAYHLNVPKQWIGHGRIVALPYDVNSAFPMLVGVGYGFGLLFKAPAFGNLLALWIAVLCAAGVLGWALERASGQYAWLGAAVFLLTPAVYNHLNVPYVDIALAMFSLVSFWSFTLWVRTGQSAWIALSGMFCGFGLGAKYLAMVGTMLVGSGILWEGVSKRLGTAKTLRLLFLFGFCALATSFVWYLRSCLQMGNPVYPFLSHWFGGKPSGIPWQLTERTYGVGYDMRHLLTLFWDATFHPTAYAGFGTRWNLLFLGLLPFVLWFVLCEGVGWLGAFAVAILLSWFYLSQVMRFLMPFFPLYCVILAWSCRKLENMPRALRRTVWAWILVICFWETGSQAVHAKPQILAARSLRTREEFLLKREPTYGIAKWVNENLPPASRIVAEMDVRLFYFRPEVIREQGLSLFSSYGQKGSSAQDALAFLKQQGFTHVLIREQIGGTLEPSAPAVEHPHIVKALVNDASAFRLVHETSCNYAGGKYVYKLYVIL